MSVSHVTVLGDFLFEPNIFSTAYNIKSPNDLASMPLLVAAHVLPIAAVKCKCSSVTIIVVIRQI